MKPFPLFALSLLLFCSCGKSGYDVYLMIGQSNMAGRGTLLDSDFAQGPEEGVFLLDSLDTPVPATHPYNQYSTIRKDIKMQQMGPSYSFGREMHKRTGREVLLVVNALGGSGLNSWMPGEFNFEEAVRRTRAAQQYGTLKAIVWHQGCTDAERGLTGTYLDRLSVMVSALRDSLACAPQPAARSARSGKSATCAAGDRPAACSACSGKSATCAAGDRPAARGARSGKSASGAAGDQPAARSSRSGKSAAGSSRRGKSASGGRSRRAPVPFVAGEIARWHRCADEFNTMLRAIPDRIPNSAVISSEGCGMLRDEHDPHFSRDAQLLLGQRYADEVSRLLQ